MDDVKKQHQQILKNTIFLYFRMLCIMLIALYTSRVVLKVLGVEDYGIYNVVGSIVSMFSFINFATTSAIQRFLTYELGTGDTLKLSKIFNISLFINISVCIILLILGESIGYWFVLNKLNIPVERLSAAIWVYQFSLFACVCTIVSATYNAVVIAHERMVAYAYISIVESLFKLLIVLLLSNFAYDKLKIYGSFLFVVQFLILFIYIVFCRKKFIETKIKLVIDKIVLKEIFAFSIWNLSGTAAYVISTQGVNILLNMFVGPIANAARGIAIQVQTAIQSLGSSFQQALNPQITKSYASGDLHYMHHLVILSSKYTFYLLLLLSFPVFFETEFILTCWLKIVPEYTVNFVRLILLITIVACVSSPIMISAFATGNIKKFQIVDSAILYIQLPISYLLLKNNFSPISVFAANLILELVMFIMRMIIVFPKINMKFMTFFYQAFFPILKVGVSSLVLSFGFSLVGNSLLYFPFFMIIFSVLSVVICIYIFGLEKGERYKLKNIIYVKINTIKRSL